MTSVRTQLPYQYYSLPFCPPANDDRHYRTLNLGKGGRVLIRVMEGCSLIRVIVWVKGRN